MKQSLTSVKFSETEFRIMELVAKGLRNKEIASRVYVDRAESGLYAAYIGDAYSEQVAIKIGNQGWANYENRQPASDLGLNYTLERHYNGGHAFCVYYKNIAN